MTEKKVSRGYITKCAKCLAAFWIAGGLAWTTMSPAEKEKWVEDERAGKNPPRKVHCRCQEGPMFEGTSSEAERYVREHAAPPPPEWVRKVSEETA